MTPTPRPRDRARLDTTRYRATVDLCGALARTENRSQRSSFGQAMKGSGDLKFPPIVWLDDPGRLRKMQMALAYRWIDPRVRSNSWNA